MAKTQEELNTLKAELETLNSKIKELNEEELESIAAGMIDFEPMKNTLHKKGITIYKLIERGVLTPAHINRFATHRDFFDQFCKKLNVDPEELLEYIKNKKIEQ